MSSVGQDYVLLGAATSVAIEMDRAERELSCKERFVQVCAWLCRSLCCCSCPTRRNATTNKTATVGLNPLKNTTPQTSSVVRPAPVRQVAPQSSGTGSLSFASRVATVRAGTGKPYNPFESVDLQPTTPSSASEQSALQAAINPDVKTDD